MLTHRDIFPLMNTCGTIAWLYMNTYLDILIHGDTYLTNVLPLRLYTENDTIVVTKIQLIYYMNKAAKEDGVA